MWQHFYSNSRACEVSSEKWEEQVVQNLQEWLCLTILGKNISVGQCNINCKGHTMENLIVSSYFHKSDSSWLISWYVSIPSESQENWISPWRKKSPGSQITRWVKYATRMFHIVPIDKKTQPGPGVSVSSWWYMMISQVRWWWIFHEKSSTVRNGWWYHGLPPIFRDGKLRICGGIPLGSPRDLRDPALRHVAAGPRPPGAGCGFPTKTLWHFGVSEITWR